MKIECPSCGQHMEVELPPKKSGALKTAVKLVCLAVIIAATGMVIRAKIQAREKAEADQQAFLRGINPEKFESPYETRRRFEQESDAQLLTECSNYVGFSRILDHYVLRSSDEISNWVGKATIDYVNHNGGIERTNLIFRYWMFDHHVLGSLDTVAMWKDQERLTAIMEGRDSTR